MISRSRSTGERPPWLDLRTAEDVDDSAAEPGELRLCLDGLPSCRHQRRNCPTVREKPWIETGLSGAAGNAGLGVEPGCEAVHRSLVQLLDRRDAVLAAPGQEDPWRA